jgi:hypothetical protein
MLHLIDFLLYLTLFKIKLSQLLSSRKIFFISATNGAAIRVDGSMLKGLH